MAKKAEGTITIKDARLLHRNFSGKEGPYNAKGDRNFSVVIEDQAVVGALEADGWNVKYLPPREEGDEPVAFLPVKVKYDYKPPHIVLLTSNGRNSLDEDTVEELDHVDIQKADIIVTPYNWAFNGKTGVKAYLKTAFITIEEDELEREYAAMESGKD